jgi:hypothetical protein
MPWYNWSCDFGCGSSGGVSDPSVRNAISSRVGQMKTNGLDTVRWWMFPPRNPGQIPQIRPGSGGQLEVDPAVYADIDAALQIAEQHDIYYVFVLFAGVGSDHMPSNWINNATQRQQLAAALGPLFSRYAGNDRIMAWEIFNEPEWQVWNGLANEQNTVALGSLIANEINARTSALVTVGSAMIDGIPMWRNVALDFYSPHWYGYMSSGGWCALCRDYDSIAQQYSVSKPIVIGEWDAASGSSPLARWEHWLDAGYAGAWAWSLFSERTNDRISVDLNAARSFMQANAAALGGAPTSSSTPTSTASAPATATPTSTVTPTASPKSSVTPTATVPAKSSSTPTATAAASRTPTQSPTRTVSPTASASSTPVAAPTAGAPQCQQEFRFRDQSGHMRTVWRNVECKTGALIAPIR